VNRLEASIAIDAPADVVFDVLRDIRARAEDVPAFRGVEIRDETSDGFVATMHEHYGGRDVVVTSRFRFERPAWLTYEHLESPYGANRGRFAIHAEGGHSVLHQVHETEQDVSEGTELRNEWVALMQNQLDAICRAAEQRAGG
jgi:ribosome-associated toxin RatA of RatAB toxin-antitoxin module